MARVCSLEEKFKQSLFARLMKPNPVYDQSIIRSILTVIVPDPIAFEEHLPIFRIFTYKVLATLLMTLAFNKSCAPKSLLSEETDILERAFVQSCKNVLNVISESKDQQACVTRFKQLILTFKSVLTFDQLEKVLFESDWIWDDNRQYASYDGLIVDWVWFHQSSEE